MGCDVHMYVEKRNPENNKWEKVGKKFFDPYPMDKLKKIMMDYFGFSVEESLDILYRYLRNERYPKNKLEEHIFTKFLNDIISDEPDYTCWEDDGKVMNPCTDTPYSGRNYDLFGALAGVRNSTMELIADMDRGLPEDVSEEIYNLYDEWGMDAHSANYLYVYEIIESSYYKMTDKDLDDLYIGTYFFRDVVNSLIEIGDTENVRIVFWFDS